MKQFGDRNIYKEIIKECRTKKAAIVGMKDTKARIKVMFLPCFRGQFRDSQFDIDSLHKLWKCSLPRSDDLWALLTVYTKDGPLKPSQKTHPTSTPSSSSKPHHSSSSHNKHKRTSSATSKSHQQSQKPKSSQTKNNSTGNGSKQDSSKNDENIRKQSNTDNVSQKNDSHKQSNTTGSDTKRSTIKIVNIQRMQELTYIPLKQIQIQMNKQVTKF